MIEFGWPFVALIIWGLIMLLDLAYTLATSRRRRGADKF